MSDAVLVNPQDFDVDLHDVYAAFMWVVLGAFRESALELTLPPARLQGVL